MDAPFWALVSLVIFIGITIYVKVPKMIAKSLDDRAERIRNELEEARRLREEAQQLLAEYQRKRKEAEREAEDIVTAAEREAKLLLEEAEKKSEDYVARRSKLAEQKIAQAETDAINEVRGSVVDIAVAAANQILAGKVDDKVAADLFKQSVAEVKDRMH
jgi:F-type H+-transporting ATPase subunit b